MAEVPARPRGLFDILREAPVSDLFDAGSNPRLPGCGSWSQGGRPKPVARPSRGGLLSRLASAGQVGGQADRRSVAGARVCDPQKACKPAVRIDSSSLFQAKVTTARRPRAAANLPSSWFQSTLLRLTEPRSASGALAAGLPREEFDEAHSR